MTYILQSTMILIAAIATSASPMGRAVVVRITLNECVGALTNIEVVLAGDEENRPQLTHFPDGSWVAEWIDKRARKFPGAPLSASVRFEDGRTYCAVAQPDKDQSDRLMAKFTLDCADSRGRTMTVGTIPPTGLGSVRTLPQTPSFNVPAGCECVEKGKAHLGAKILLGVLFPAENFSVHFLNREENAFTSDLLILDPHGENPAAAVPEIFDPVIRKYALKPGADPRCKDALCLQPETIISAVGEQRARARLQLSSQEYALDEEILKRLDLLTVTVK